MERTEEQVHSELRRILAVLGLIDERLQVLAAGLPEEPARRGRQRRRAVRLRSAIECLRTDSLRPAIEALRASLKLPATGEAGGADRGVRWSEEAVVQNDWPWTLPVPPEILQLVDLAPGDIASLEAQPEGGLLLQPFRQWLRTLPTPWGQAERRAIVRFFQKDLFFIGPEGPVLAIATLPLGPAGRVVLQVV
jgi:hypothetical protein